MTSRTTSNSPSRPSSRCRRGLVAWLVLALAAFAVGPALPGAVQAQDLGQVVSPVLTVDRDRLFRESAYGKRIAAALEAERARQEQETRDIEAQLETEEQDLTDKRPTLTADEFRKLADAFDAKVQRLRDERNAAEQSLLQQIDAARVAFLEQVNPVLARIMQESGAVAILDRRAVLLAVTSVDITDRAIARIDATIGDGAGLDTLPGLDLPATRTGTDGVTPGDGAPEGLPDGGTDEGLIPAPDPAPAPDPGSE